MQQSKVVIEPLVPGEKRFVKTQVPFANAGRPIPGRLQEFGNRQLIRVQSGMRVRAMHPDLVAHSARIAAGEQAGSRGTADRSSCVIVGEPSPLFGQSINSRSFHFCRAVTPKVVVTLVVNKDKDDIWPRRFGISIR